MSFFFLPSHAHQFSDKEALDAINTYIWGNQKQKSIIRRKWERWNKRKEKKGSEEESKQETLAGTKWRKYSFHMIFSWFHFLHSCPDSTRGGFLYVYSIYMYMPKYGHTYNNDVIRRQNYCFRFQTFWTLLFFLRGGKEKKKKGPPQI